MTPPSGRARQPRWGFDGSSLQPHRSQGRIPVPRRRRATTFLKALSVGEIVTGALLLAPFVSNRVAGTALTGFSAALLGLYLRTPALRKAGSIWPSQNGTGVSKDVWMLGIGLGLIVDSVLVPDRT